MNTEIKLFTDEEIKAMGKRIQNARKKKGFKSIDFADIIGIGKDQLSRIENGKVPCKVEYLFLMAQILNVSAEYLLYGKTYMEETEHLNSLWSIMSENNRKKVIRIIELMLE